MFASTKTSKAIIANRAILAAVVFGFLGMSSIVKADQLTYGSRSKHVTLNDLDLSTAVGQLTALERLHQVARSLCSQLSDNLDLSKQSNYVACVDSATAKAAQNLQAMVSRKGSVLLALNQIK
jgi:UrcA family protein